MSEHEMTEDERAEWEAELLKEFEAEGADRWKEFIDSDDVKELWAEWEKEAWEQWLTDAEETLT